MVRTVTLQHWTWLKIIYLNSQRLPRAGISYVAPRNTQGMEFAAIHFRHFIFQWAFVVVHYCLLFNLTFFAFGRTFQVDHRGTIRGNTTKRETKFTQNLTDSHSGFLMVLQETREVAVCGNRISPKSPLHFPSIFFHVSNSLNKYAQNQFVILGAMRYYHPLITTKHNEKGSKTSHFFLPA